VNSKFKVQIKKAKEKGRRNIKEKGKTLPGPAATNSAHFLLPRTTQLHAPHAPLALPRPILFLRAACSHPCASALTGPRRQARRSLPTHAAHLWQVGPSCRCFLLPALARTDEHAVSSARFSGTVQQPWTGSRGKVGA
jgi:hypothetical protein